MSRFFQVAKYAWKQSSDIAVWGGKNRLSIFLDMLLCYIKYRMWTNQYFKEELWMKTPEQRKQIGLFYIEKNKVRDAWQRDFRENRDFIIKYSNIKYEKSYLREKRNRAYA